MKLHAFHREMLVPQAHDHARAVRLRGMGADFQLRRQARFRNNQRMITGGSHGAGSAAEDCLAVMLNAADLSVHDLIGPDYFAAEGGPNSLMSQTYTENRLLAGEIPDEINADAGFLRSAWPGRNQDMRRTQAVNLLEGDLVIPTHLDLLAHFTQVLHQVVSEGIVVIENEDHGEETVYISPETEIVRIAKNARIPHITHNFGLPYGSNNV